MRDWMKRAVAIAIAVIFVLSTIMVSFGAEMSDVSSHWSKAYVNEMVNKGIITGYTDGTFKPEAPVSRLEAIVMISRLYSSAEIDSVYASSKALYEADFKKYAIPAWAQKSLVFTMQKGLVPSSILTNVMSGDKQLEAKRYEIPVYLGRALGFSDDSKVYVLDFEDADKIPKSALPYIGYMADKKIVSGQTNYPSTSILFNSYGIVKRGEMAKMLKLTADIMGTPSQPVVAPTDEAVISIKGTVYSVSQSNGSITLIVENSAGTKLTFKNTSSAVAVTKVLSAGSISDIASGMEVELEVSGDKLYSVEIKESSTSSSNLEGYFQKTYFKLESDGSNRAYVVIEVDGSDKEYPVGTNIKVTLDGKASNVYSLSADDKVSFEVVNGAVTEVEAFSKSGSVTGYVKKIDSNGKYMIITDKKDDDVDYRFNIDSKADVERNGEDAELSDVRVGDDVTLSLKYAVITDIDAESVTRKVTGVLKEIVISGEPKVTIQDEDKKLVTYQLSPEFEVEIDGKSAGLYDLRLNYELVLRLETDIVKTIEADDQVVISTITGEIESISTSDDTIKLTDSSTKKTVYVRYTSNTTLEDYDGDTLRESGFSRGDIISVIGKDNVGSFSADRIIKIK